MARFDDSAPYTADYDDDCATCGEEFPRGDLAWDPSNDLECAGCEHKRIQRTADPMAAQGYTVECQGAIYAQEG